MLGLAEFESAGRRLDWSSSAQVDDQSVHYQRPLPGWGTLQDDLLMLYALWSQLRRGGWAQWALGGEQWLLAADDLRAALRRLEAPAVEEALQLDLRQLENCLQTGDWETTCAKLDWRYPLVRPAFAEALAARFPPDVCRDALRPLAGWV